MKIPFILIISAIAASSQDSNNPCENNLYCYGPLLEKIQLAHFYDDNKLFVDKKLLFDKDVVLAKYDEFITQFPDPSLEQLEEFVDANFGNETSQFDPYDPPDWNENPEFLQNIHDPPLREFAKSVNAIWLKLGRKMVEDVKDNPERYSLIYVPNPHIVPGGRFAEFYYWDTYWIMQGLLLSEMTKTVKGMLENFLHMVEEIGYIPNGGRIYFERSQPPLLIPMVKMYLDATNDTSFITDANYDLLVKEFDFFWNNRAINFSYNSSQYTMLRYNVELGGPRPESYSVDYKLATGLSTSEKNDLFMHIKSACESGWDFSSRWFVPRTSQKATLRDVKTRDIIPVDLNAFFFRAAKDLELISTSYGKDGTRFGVAAETIKKGIHEVLWVDSEGAWFDYNIKTNKHNMNYYASNVATLWANAQHEDVDLPKKIVAYLENTGALNYPGGLPTSLINSGEQWDFPAAWAPLQELVVLALLNTKDIQAEEVAYKIAEKFVIQAFKTFNNEKYNNTMFEKYDVRVVGEPASGGEYKVVEGFGWTNGVVLSFLNRFGQRLRADHPPPCENNLYCYGPLLEKIQLAHFYDDNKLFVDKKLLFDKDVVLANYDEFITQFPDPSLEQLEEFVDTNFGNETSQFDPYDPPDWNENPEFLQNIHDPPLREFAKSVNAIWLKLGRKMIDDVGENRDRYSLIHVPNAHIVPGGRFTEFYYWDTYWIMEGLLISGMNQTVKEMLANFFYMVEEIGYIPNGGRVYFERSQPPLLIPMVKMYLDATNDIDFIRDNYNTLVKEFDFFWTNRKIIVKYNDVDYEMLRYNVELGGPRPESYSVDYKLATGLSTYEKDELFMHIKSACESGWDFSSRWFVPRTNQKMTLRDVKTRDIIPVDLNAFFYRAVKELEMISNTLEEDGTPFANVAAIIKKGLEEVLWIESEGAWFDYNIKTNKHNMNYYASNVATLWANAQHEDVDLPKKVIAYLENTGALNYPGGLPTSLINSGEQWDFPAAWAPLQELVVGALLNTKDIQAENVAYKIAEKFVLQTFKTFNNKKYNNTMFEKYDVRVVGEPASGGEYKVVEGFGWTNGVALSFLNRFGQRLRADPYESNYPPPCQNNLYCYGPLVETVQLAQIYDDGKTFVDKRLLFDKEEVLANFNDFITQTPDPSQGEIEEFVDQNFGNESSFVPYEPTDWTENPEFLQEIHDDSLRDFAERVHGIWRLLGKKVIEDVKDNSERYSQIYVPNGHIVPGGRFREFFYWDTYWIIEGLLVSGMTETVKGMLENFFYMLEKDDYLRNGGRVYLERTQPPLLIPMVKMYLDATNDTSLLTDRDKANYKLLVKEFDYFWTNRKINVTYNDVNYEMLHYNVEKTGPRPEAYSFEYKLGLGLSTSEKDEMYINIKSACESGWDFSSRWFVPGKDQTTLRNTKTRDIIPVDLNAFFYRASSELQKISLDLEVDGSKFESASAAIKRGLKEVLWVENAELGHGAWFDYNTKTGQHNFYYYASNVATLWANAQHEDAEIPNKVVSYLESTGALNFPGGLPTSLNNSGEQWDFPAAWAPLQEIVVGGLLNTKNARAEELAFKIAEKFVLQTYKTFNNEAYNNTMFEKYDVRVVGEPASGGEYKVVEGFGWTNGVALSFMKRYGSQLTSEPKVPDSGVNLVPTLLSLLFAILVALIY